MKRIIYIIATLVAVALTACGPKGDETMDAMNEFMENQELPGIYRKSTTEFVLDESKHQCYLSPNHLTFRIMDEGGDKYLQFTLSKAPVLGEYLDIETTSYGFGLSSSTTYTNLKVEKLEGNRCTLRSDAEGGYIGIIIDWITE